MKSKADYWHDSALEWEVQRYDRPWSRLFYWSLHNRRAYLAWIVDQLPKSWTIVELGCGSGRVYEKIKSKDRTYIGLDISRPAIEMARSKHQQTTWKNLATEDVRNFENDLSISAGLIDWLNDSQISQLMLQNRFNYFIHSISLADETDWKVKLHRIFSMFIRRNKKVDYSPRRFSEREIKQLFGENTNIICHRNLSFGAIAHNLPAQVDISFETFLKHQYFSKKKDRMGFFEKWLKTVEADSITKISGGFNSKKILEIGSGFGYYTRLVISQNCSEILSIDPAVSTDLYVSSPIHRHLNESLERFNLDGKSWDLVLVLGILEFIENTDTALKKLRELMSINTKLLIMLPRRHGLIPYGYRLYHRLFGRKLTCLRVEDVCKYFASEGYGVVIHKAGPLNVILEVMSEQSR